jgi:hypothetical protein
VQVGRAVAHHTAVCQSRRVASARCPECAEHLLWHGFRTGSTPGHLAGRLGPPLAFGARHCRNSAPMTPYIALARPGGRSRAEPGAGQ